jgi:hypothetical protein
MRGGTKMLDYRTAWKQFEKTGKIKFYLKYRALLDTETAGELGGEYGLAHQHNRACGTRAQN